MKAEAFFQKLQGEAERSKTFLSLIRNESTLPERDVDAVRGLVAEVFVGVRDLCAIYSEDRFLEDKEQYTKNTIDKYSLQSSVIYLTTDQRDLIKPDNARYLELRELGLESHAEGERARTNIREIKRLQEIYVNSHSPIALGLISKITLENKGADAALDVVVEYTVPHSEVDRRTRNYEGAFELLNKELIKLFTEQGFGTNGARFIRNHTGRWDYSLVKEQVLKVIPGGDSPTRKQRAA